MLFLDVKCIENSANFQLTGELLKHLYFVVWLSVCSLIKCAKQFLQTTNKMSYALQYLHLQSSFENVIIYPKMDFHAVYIFGVCEHRHSKFGTQIDHGKQYQPFNWIKNYRKRGCGYRDRTSFKFWNPDYILKLGI